MKKIRIILAPFIRILKNHSRQTVIKKSAVLITLIQLALLKRLFKSTKKVNISIGQFSLTSPDYATLSFLIKEKFVDEQYYFEELDEKPIIFDCGSSIGISVLYFKCMCPQAAVYAFEPNPAAFEFLKTNVKNNNLTNINCYNLALSATESDIDFFIPKENSFINAKTIKNHPDECETINVAARPLSAFLLPFAAVHLVKIDVEGSELAIMEDLKKEVLKRKIVKKYIIEYHTSIHPDLATLDNFLADFTNNGYLHKFINAERAETEVDKLIAFYLPG